MRLHALTTSRLVISQFIVCIPLSLSTRASESRNPLLLLSCPQRLPVLLLGVFSYLSAWKGIRCEVVRWYYDCVSVPQDENISGVVYGVSLCYKPIFGEAGADRLRSKPFGTSVEWSILIPPVASTKFTTTEHRSAIRYVVQPWWYLSIYDKLKQSSSSHHCGDQNHGCVLPRHRLKSQTCTMTVLDQSLWSKPDTVRTCPFHCLISQGCHLGSCYNAMPIWTMQPAQNEKRSQYAATCSKYVSQNDHRKAALVLISRFHPIIGSLQGSGRSEGSSLRCWILQDPRWFWRVAHTEKPHLEILEQRMTWSLSHSTRVEKLFMQVQI